MQEEIREPKEENPKDHPAWLEFEAWFKNEYQDCAPEETGDFWQRDWDAFLAGYNAGHNAAWLWNKMDTAPMDGSNILLLTKTRGIVEAWFDKGQVIPATPEYPEDYSGDVWVCADDEFQIEAEFDGKYWHHGDAIGWLPIQIREV